MNGSESAGAQMSMLLGYERAQTSLEHGVLRSLHTTKTQPRDNISITYKQLLHIDSTTKFSVSAEETTVKMP